MKDVTKLKIVRYLYQVGPGTAVVTGSGSDGKAPFLGGVFSPDQTLAQFFNTAFKAAIIIGAMLAVLRLGYAGFVYLTTDVISSKQTARSIISNAVMGLLLLLAVWLILNQINPNILNLNILQGVQTTPAQPTQLPAAHD